MQAKYPYYLHNDCKCDQNVEKRIKSNRTLDEKNNILKQREANLSPLTRFTGICLFLHRYKSMLKRTCKPCCTSTYLTNVLQG